MQGRTSEGQGTAELVVTALESHARTAHRLLVLLQGSARAMAGGGGVVVGLSDWEKGFLGRSTRFRHW